MPVVPHGQSLALLHGALELRLQFVLGAGELRLRLLDTRCDRHMVGKASHARSADSAAGGSPAPSAAAIELSCLSSAERQRLTTRQSLEALPFLSPSWGAPRADFARQKTPLSLR